MRNRFMPLEMPTLSKPGPGASPEQVLDYLTALVEQARFIACVLLLRAGMHVPDRIADPMPRTVEKLRAEAGVE